MTHMDEGALVRFLDGECEVEEREEVAAHLEECGDCTVRLRQLDAYGRTVSVLLRQADLPRRRSRWPGRVRAAAAVIVLLGIAGSISPVRAWILDRTQAIWSAVMGETPAAVEEPQTAAQEEETASVRFVPAAGPFLVEIATGQTQGSLVVETTDDATASARVRGGSGSEHLVVMPNGLRIENETQSGASYRVRLPAALDDVAVVVGDGAAQRLSPTNAGLRWEIDLRANAAGAPAPVRTPRSDSLEQ